MKPYKIMHGDCLAILRDMDSTGLTKAELNQGQQTLFSETTI